MKALLSIVLLTIIFAAYSCQLKVKKTVNIKVDSIQKPKPVRPISKAEADTERYEDSAMDKVWDLPEIKYLAKRFDKENSDTAHHFALNVPGRPHKGFNYYWVRAGEDTPDHFATYEHFYVDAKDFTVYYYDVVSDSVLTIDQWRKSGKDDLYHKR